MKNKIILSLLLSAPLLVIAETTHQDQLGALLYQNHCSACHDSAVHIRERKISKGQDDIRYQVTRWQNNQHLNWNNEQIESVVQYLNKTFYQF